MFFSCEQEKLLKIEDYLQKYVVGQDQAIFADIKQTNIKH